MRQQILKLLLIAMLPAGFSPSAQAAVYKEVNGFVSVEAEHFDSRKASGDDDKKWVLVPDEGPGVYDYVNARGGKHLEVQPNAGQNRNSPDLFPVGPTADYKVQITTVGEYRLWLRTIGADGGSDSMYASIIELRPDAGGPGPANWYRKAPLPNGLDFDTLNDGLGWDGNGGADVVSGDTGGDPMLWNITKAGTYTVRVYQREDGVALDAFVLQRSNLPDPSKGTPESPVEGIFVLITKQPNNIVVAAGATANFAVEAAGSSPVTYKWQKAAPGSSTFADIAGATSASYTTAAATPADSGSKYRAVISIPTKSDTTREVSLTVDTQAAAIARVTGSGSFTMATVVFTEAVTSDTAGNKANYSADAGLTISDAKVVNATTVRLTTSTQTSGTKYTVTAKNIKDLVGNTPVDSKSIFTGYVLSRGVLAFEAYSGIPGVPVDLLVSDPKYPNSPDEIGYVTAFDTRTIYPTDSHDNYGARISGWLVPAETAQYEFFLRSDDAGQLFLSPDDKSANAIQVAEETGCCGAFEESGATETTAPVSLTAGKRYFIQVLYKEGGGGDYAQVAWRKVGGTAAASTLAPIPGSFLEAYASPDVTLSITQQPSSATAAAGTPVTLSVRYDALSFLGKAASVQWQKNGVNIAGATSQDYTIAFADPADSGAKFRAVVSVSSLATVNSSEATLTVTTDTQAPTFTGVNGTAKSVRLSFSEPLSPASGTDKANYAIDKGATVAAAKVVSGANDAAIVQLDITGATAGTVYTVTMNNIKDKSNNTLAANTKAVFVAYHAFYDFDDGALPAGTTAYGPAAILPGRGFNGGSALMLTPSVNSQQGGFLIPDLANGAAVTKFTVSFKLWIGEGSGNAADGFSFSFASDVPEATVGEEGAGTGIIVAFDTYDNGGAEAPAVDVKYGGAEVETKKVTKAVLVNNRYVDVMIRLNAGGTLDVMHSTTNYYTKLALPGFAPLSGGRILIGARTGGERELHLVDNFAILLNADVPELPKPTETPKFTNVARNGANINITWTGIGALQSADSVTGPWGDVANATSPFSAAISGTAKFYRFKP